MLKVKIEVRVKCEKHPGYDPAKDGRAGIRGACANCEAVLNVYDRALEFQGVADPAKPIPGVRISVAKFRYRT